MFNEKETKASTTRDSLGDRIDNAMSALEYLSCETFFDLSDLYDRDMTNADAFMLTSSNLIDERIIKALASICYKHKNQLTVLKILEDALSITDPNFELK